MRVTMPSASNFAVPVLVMAAESGIIPATRIKVCQAIDRCAWPMVTTRVRTMAMAARRAATAAGAMLVVIMTTIAARMARAGMASGPSGTVWRRMASVPFQRVEE